MERLIKKGYSSKEHVWRVGENGVVEVRDDKGLSKVENVAEYCGY